MRSLSVRVIAVTIFGIACCSCASEPPTREDARRALAKAATFFHSEVSSNGGYVWRYSGDLALREGEAKATKTMIWVQPPGTPTVGQAFLDAYEATGHQLHLDAALDAAHALVKGQLRTGGWAYHIEFDPEKRQEYAYRDVPQRKTTRWKKATQLDDDTTQSATRFLMRLDNILGLKDQKIHEAVTYALNSMVRAQFPNGGWYAWWDRYPDGHTLPVERFGGNLADYPVLRASYPASWSRTWTKDFSGCYVINDDLMADMIAVMFDAYDIYGDERYLASAKKAGGFLVLAQMPEPQPAWAQQYDRDMHPAWSRKFEPPAITALESQGVIEALLQLYGRTGDKKYLEPIPRAITYLRKSQLPDGRLARFCELETNRPLYFTKDYKLTYSRDEMPKHYSFVVDSRLAELDAEYRQLLGTDPAELAEKQGMQRVTPELAAEVRSLIAGMDARGAWVAQEVLDAHDLKPASGVIECRAFAENVRTLCKFISAAR